MSEKGLMMPRDTTAARMKIPVRYVLVKRGLLKYQDLKSESASSIYTFCLLICFFVRTDTMLYL